ncbi:hypothetical protein AGABI1DRAFT_128749 [Agaricus bisporus var. burnettii JB137-S8]|uniref:Uncharacterized protein n=1 Tax=Agaricus bisporus var. burnettii (strain JB137-S8 / ATCC MYA-4627 / FGSC 10392) TaxID=597362 RepID=K5XWL4_AGABU|nr:uncharacterized protein AGABI1DRAFT_128749 [Agaricus bisporus var. burnettii JB137-S8]EKM79605.1 hypothetical protein AGABI1DRAFT_128749 [Agaricus bisporus var. burnettii JB137-S8]
MSSSHPLVCIFFKLPPSRQSLLRIHEIAWNVFLPQLNRLNDTFEAVQAAHPSPEVNIIWSEARQFAAEKMNKLQDVVYQNYETGSHFLEFAEALQLGRSHSDEYDEFRYSTCQAYHWAPGSYQSRISGG